MQLRRCERGRAMWITVLFVALASLGLSGCSDEPTGEGASSDDTVRSQSAQGTTQSDSSGYFADSVVAAWEKAGAEALWLVHSDDGQITVRRDPPNSMFLNLKAAEHVPTYLPGFMIPNWEDGMTEGLPVPKVGFGLYLSPSGIRDSGLTELARFDTLESLNFYQGRITDAGVKELAALKNLRALSLHNTDLTDVAAKELAQIKTLEYVDLGGTNVRISGGALFELQQTLPNCTIFRRR
jgi:hypothetical protein